MVGLLVGEVVGLLVGEVGLVVGQVLLVVGLLVKCLSVRWSDCEKVVGLVGLLVGLVKLLGSKLCRGGTGCRIMVQLTLQFGRVFLVTRLSMSTDPSLTSRLMASHQSAILIRHEKKEEEKNVQRCQKHQKWGFWGKKLMGGLEWMGGLEIPRCPLPSDFLTRNTNF